MLEKLIYLYEFTISSPDRHRHHADSDKKLRLVFLCSISCWKGRWYRSTKLNLCSTSDYMCVLFTQHSIQEKLRGEHAVRLNSAFTRFYNTNVILSLHANLKLFKNMENIKLSKCAFSISYFMCQDLQQQKMFHCFHGLDILVRRESEWKEWDQGQHGDLQ